MRRAGMPRLAHDPRGERSSGFTLLELSVGSAIFLILFIAAWQLFDGAGKAMHHGVKSSELDGTLRAMINRLTEELRDSGTGDDDTEHVISHPITQDTTASSVTFQRRVAFTGDPDLDWGPAITFALEASPGETPANNIDDDGDGLIDEQRITRTQNGQPIVIADGIVGMEFERTTGSQRIDFEVTVARVLKRDEAPLTRRMNSSVALRNVP